jgi:hypothetical protein
MSVAAFKCLKLRRLNKNSLRGFVSLRLPSGLTLHDCSWHQQPDGREWIGLPSRSYQVADSTTKWAPIVEFDADATRERQAFQRLALEAVHAAAAEQDDPLAELLP